MTDVTDSGLGKPTHYPDERDPGLLLPLARSQGREGLAVDAGTHFRGCDIWHAWEFSWLDDRGKPCNAVARFTFDAAGTHLIESKSFKLYLNSFAQTRFASTAELHKLLQQELHEAADGPVTVDLLAVDDPALAIQPLAGNCIDDLDIDIDHYGPPRASLLEVDHGRIEEQCWLSHLFRSNCPVTGQPDWASVQITCHGPRIDPASLLRYLVSFRRHNGFHEQCVETIFDDIRTHCQPQALSVYACFTRRGGLDISPWRSNREIRPPRIARTTRQ